jgi:hypothetical protein
MLSLFDRVDEYPAVEDDQRHVNLVLCPQRLRRLLELCPVSTLGCLRSGLRLRHGRAADAERRTEIHFGPGEIALVPASSKVAHMPTIEITEFSSLLLPASLRHILVLSSGVRRTRPGCESVKVKETSPSEPADRTQRTATTSLIAQTGAMARNGHSAAKLLSALAAEPGSYRHLTSAAVSGRIDSHALSNASKKSLDANPVISTTRWVGRHLASTNSTCESCGMRRVIHFSRI